MKVEKLCAVICISLAIVIGGCVPTAQMKLSLAPQSETVYKVTMETSKDYSFVQPSINKTKERHTVGKVEMVFAQKIESVDGQGSAIADISVKQLKYLSQNPEGKSVEFDSENEQGKADPLAKLVGVSYKIKITPKGSVEVVDVAAARGILKSGSAGKVAERLFSDEEIARRHQVMALFDAKGPCKKGDKWSSLAASPGGMLKPKTFEKIYTVTDVKQQNKQTTAVVTMNAVPSSKRSEELAGKEPAMGFFANMFDEKDEYTGKMVVNLTTGVISSYQETLKAQWLAAESPDDQKSDKGPDQLTMGFTSIYSIEKVD
ncbi:MAG: DUF6263 family protein [Phycisphaerae bacterium]|jgi:hypothetical protein